MISIQDIIGYLGLILVLIPFILEELNKLDYRSKTYNILNIIGSAVLVWYSIQTKVYVFTIANLIWVLFALYALIKNKKK